MGV
ncbi:unnamed protein product [Lasius platythorax]|jgi:hypothetical protein